MNYLGGGHWPKPGVDHVRGLVKAGDPQSLFIKGFAAHMLADHEGKHGTKHYSQADKDAAANLLMKDGALFKCMKSNIEQLEGPLQPSASPV
jgi:hypothetical protein